MIIIIFFICFHIIGLVASVYNVLLLLLRKSMGKKEKKKEKKRVIRKRTLAPLA